MTQTIYIINNSTLFDLSSVETILPALQEQVTRDFAPLWGVDATLEIAEAANGDWNIILQDHAGQANDLGFHTDPNGVPTAIIGIADAQKYNVAISAVMSHEILEMLADPTTTRMIGNYIVEVCDPVSGDYYEINGVTVSNFCTPRYFGYTTMGNFDQLGHLQAGSPTVLPGGMVMFWNGTSWASTFARHVDGKLPWRVHYSGRSTYRASTPLETPTVDESSITARRPWQDFFARWW